MKIIIYAGNCGSGGLKGYLKGFISACEELDDEVYLICTPKFAPEIEKACINGHIKIIPAVHSKMSFVSMLFHNRLHSSIVKIIDSIKPDIVFYTNSIIHKGTENYLNAVGFHNQLFVEPKQLNRLKFSRTWLTLLLTRHRVICSLKNADLCVFDSQDSYHKATLYGVRVKDYVVAYFGVDENEKAIEYRKSNTISKTTNLLYVSTFFAYKNQYELVLSIAEMRKRGHNIHLDLVGSGDKHYINKVKKAVRDNSLEEFITLHSWVDHSKIQEMIDSCDIFIYASSIETSGFGLMEGMARGVPIACNDESCMPEILNESGVVFHIHSPTDVADKIQSLIEKESFRDELAQKAYATSNKYTWKQNVQTVVEAFLRINH